MSLTSHYGEQLDRDDASGKGSPSQPIKFQPLAPVTPSGQQPYKECTQSRCTQRHAAYSGEGACFSWGAAHDACVQCTHRRIGGGVQYRIKAS